MTGDVVLETLTEKIQRQDRLIAQLQADLEQARQASVDRMLGQLRLREAVLLYVGNEADNFAQQLAENFGSEVARAVSANLFVLDNAPVLPEAREAIRQATEALSYPRPTTARRNTSAAATSSPVMYRRGPVASCSSRWPISGRYSTITSLSRRIGGASVSTTWRPCSLATPPRWLCQTRAVL